MSNTVQCNSNKEDVADDWEDASDDALVASVAERQKRLAQDQTKMAAEQQQLKIEQSKPNTTNTRPDLNNAPVRLLRRPQSGAQLGQKTDAELAKEAEERAQKALEEREAAYQQAREKIFGEQQQLAENAAQGTSAEQVLLEASTSGNRDHLSDVPMKRADTYRPKVTVPPPVPPPMMFPQWGYPPPPHIPPYTGIPPVNFPPYYGPPVTSAVPMGYQQPQYGPLNPFQMPPPVQQNNQQQPRPVPLSSVNPKVAWNNQSPQNMGIPPMLGQVQYPPYNYSQPKNSTRFPNQ